MELPSFYRIFFHIILQALQERGFAIRKIGVMRLLVVTSSMFAGSNALSANTVNLLQLKKDVASFLAENYANTDYKRVDIQIGNIDQRLRITPCDQPLNMTTQDSTGLGGNITVNVQCSSPHRWSIHIPAQVFIFATTPVAAKPLTRGNVITAADITEALINISLIRQEFIASPQLAIGKEVKRNINQGEPLRNAHLDAPTAVKRGDLIELSSVAGSIRVITTGTAMSDGRIGQTIRVRNSQSTRVVSAQVIASGQAHVE